MLTLVKNWTGYRSIKIQFSFSFRGLRLPDPLTLPLDPAGGSAPDPRYRLALPARHVVSHCLEEISATGLHDRHRPFIHE